MFLRHLAALTVAGSVAGSLSKSRLSSLAFSTSSDALIKFRGVSKHDVERPKHIPPRIWNNLELGMHRNLKHPVGIVKKSIENFFRENSCILKLCPKEEFKTFDTFNSIISTKRNFDELGVPEFHVSRKPSDTYYIDHKNVLKTQGTAHQTDMLRAGLNKAVWSTEVVRRDEVDALHYPIFHQMDGICLWKVKELETEVFNRYRAEEVTAGCEAASIRVGDDLEKYRLNVINHLKETMEKMVQRLLGDSVKTRWDYNATFPFTDPSLELEVFYKSNWVELLGCGLITNQILENCQRHNHIGWAFGVGLERIAMIKYDIPDIRFFWTEDPRFLRQFENVSPDNVKMKFQIYSKNPPVYKDLAFWVPDGFNENDFYDICREVAGDLLEQVELIDTYTNQNKKQSYCYRLTYRCLDSNLTHDRVNDIQSRLISECRKNLCLSIR